MGKNDVALFDHCIENYAEGLKQLTLAQHLFCNDRQNKMEEIQKELIHPVVNIITEIVKKHSIPRTLLDALIISIINEFVVPYREKVSAN